MHHKSWFFNAFFVGNANEIEENILRSAATVLVGNDVKSFCRKNVQQHPENNLERILLKFLAMIVNPQYCLSPEPEARGKKI